MREIDRALSEVLSEAELNRLNTINKITDHDQRNSKLRSFFHEEEIFSKVSSVGDPAWVSYMIFINGRSHEF